MCQLLFQDIHFDVQHVDDSVLPWVHCCSFTLVQWKLHDLSVELVELKPWPSWVLFPCSSALTKNLGGTFQVTNWVLILNGIYSRSIHNFEFATSTSIHHQLGCSLMVATLLEWMVAYTWKKCHGIMVPPRTPREEPIWLHYLEIFIQLQRNFQP
jgi:hypothetical protein